MAGQRRRTAQCGRRAPRPWSSEGRTDRSSLPTPRPRYHLPPAYPQGGACRLLRNHPLGGWPGQAAARRLASGPPLRPSSGQGRARRRERSPSILAVCAHTARSTTPMERLAAARGSRLTLGSSSATTRAGCPSLPAGSSGRARTDPPLHRPGPCAPSPRSVGSNLMRALRQSETSGCRMEPSVSPARRASRSAAAAVGRVPLPPSQGEKTIPLVINPRKIAPISFVLVGATKKVESWQGQLQSEDHAGP